MIDLFRAEKFFKEYVSNFKVADKKIDVKIKHTYGVVSISKYIAEGLKLSEEDILLAQLIALLHDIGRFEQAVKFNDFDDYNTMDHAEYGVKILFEDGLIENFIEDRQFDKIIENAIRNHNKFDIEYGLEDRELLHAKIIRDADKTDNFRIKQIQDFLSLFKSTEEEVSKELITDEVWKEFLGEKTIISSHRITNMDKWLSYIAWVYDYNFDVSLKYLKENDCVDKVIDRLDYKEKDTKEKMEYVREVIKKYIDDRLIR